MNAIGWIAIIVVLGIGLLVLGPPIVVRVLARSLRPRVEAAIPQGEIILADYTANSLGLASRGKFQQRGNGALVLTGDALWFFQAVPRRDLRIPIEAVSEVGTARSHLGKTYFRDLLRVSFTASGAADTGVWYVSDVPRWLAALADQRKA